MKKCFVLILLLTSLGVFPQSHVVSDSLVYKLTRSLNKIDTNNIDIINVNDIKLDEIEVKLNEVLSTIVAGKRKPDFDIYKLEKKVNKYRSTINRQNARLDLLFYNKALDYLNRKSDRASAEKYLEKSLEVNSLYIPSLYKLSLILTEDGELKRASELMTVMLNKTYPGTSDVKLSTISYQLVLALANNIYHGFIKKTEELKLQEKYNDADEELLIAKQYCNSNTIINCKDSVEKEIISTKFGMYKSYLSVAERAIYTRHYDIAESFIFSAMAYRKKNGQYIKEYKDAEKMMENVIDIYMNKANSYISSGKYQKAMECFAKASALCDSINDDVCNKRIRQGISSIKINVYNELVNKAQEYMKKGQSDIARDYLEKAKSYKNSNLKDISDSSIADVILRQIKDEEYKRLIHEGKDYIDANNYDYAFKSLYNADILEKKYGLENDNEKDSLIKIAAKPVIKEKLKTCDVKIWANELKEAGNFLKSCEDMQLRYYLINDKEINFIISALKQKLLDRQCGNDRDAYDLLMFKARDLVRKLDYTGAIRIYDDAINLVSKYHLCKIDVDLAMKNKNEYQIPANYQLLTEEADDFYNKQDYKSFLDRYIAAERFYTSLNVNDYGLKHLPLFDLILNRDNDKLTLAATQYFINNSQPDKALNLLKHLKDKNFQSELTKDLQEKLAISYAKRDKVTKNKTSAKDNISTYTANSKWFKYFNRKYKQSYH